MKIIRALDSCLVAAYKMFNGKQQTVVNAITIVFFTSAFYWLDAVILLNRVGVLSYLNLSARLVIFIGGACIALAHLLIFLPRASMILRDSSLESSRYRLLHYVFFCSPAIIFFIFIFLEIGSPK